MDGEEARGWMDEGEGNDATGLFQTKDGCGGRRICGTMDECGMDVDRRRLSRSNRRRTSLQLWKIDENDPSGRSGCERQVLSTCWLVDSKQVNGKETWDDEGTKKEDKHVHVEPFVGTRGAGWETSEERC